MKLIRISIYNTDQITMPNTCVTFYAFYLVPNDFSFSDEDCENSFFVFFFLFLLYLFIYFFVVVMVKLKLEQTENIFITGFLV